MSLGAELRRARRRRFVYASLLCLASACVRSGFEAPDAADGARETLLDAQAADAGRSDAALDAASADAATAPDAAATDAADAAIARDAATVDAADAAALPDAAAADSAALDAGATDSAGLDGGAADSGDASGLSDAASSDLLVPVDAGGPVDAWPPADVVATVTDAGTEDGNAGDAGTGPATICSGHLVIEAVDTYRSMISAGKMTLQADGKILSTGSMRERIPIYGYVARHDSSGLRDTSFATDGFLRQGAVRLVDDVTSLADGTLIAGGGSTTGELMAFHADNDGVVFSSYGSSGTAIISHSDPCSTNAVATTSDGSASLAGSCNTNNPDMALARFTPAGQPDPGLGGSGLVTVEFGRDSVAFDLALLASGQVLLAGKAAQSGNSDGVALARLESDGSLDQSFGTLGLVQTDLGANDAYARAVAIQADGKIVIAGSIDNGAGYDMLVARFEANGDPDQSFGSGGMVAMDFGNAVDHAKDLKIQSDGRIVVAGSTFVTNWRLVVARLTTTGDLDQGFASGGVYTLDEGNSSQATSVAIGGMREIYAYGSRGSGLVIARLDSAGAPQTWPCSPQ